MKINHS